MSRWKIKESRDLNSRLWIPKFECNVKLSISLKTFNKSGKVWYNLSTQFKFDKIFINLNQI